MAIDQNSRLTRGVQPVGIDQRVALGFDEAHVFHADALEFGGEKFGGAAAVVLVLGQRGDGRDAQQGFQFIEKARVVLRAKATADEDMNIAPQTRMAQSKHKSLLV